jgi:hypothetical protein
MVTGEDLVPIFSQGIEDDMPRVAQVHSLNSTIMSKVYGNSKLAQILHVQRLQRYLDSLDEKDWGVESKDRLKVNSASN